MVKEIKDKEIERLRQLMHIYHMQSYSTFGMCETSGEAERQERAYTLYCFYKMLYLKAIEL